MYQYNNNVNTPCQPKQKVLERVPRVGVKLSLMNIPVISVIGTNYIDKHHYTTSNYCRLGILNKKPIIH